MEAIALPERHARQFVPADFTVTTWAAVQPLYDQLLAWAPTTYHDYLDWLAACDELQAVLQEDLGWRYIRMSRATDDGEARAAYAYFLEHISPKAQPLDQALRKRLYESPFRQKLDPERYGILLRSVGTALALYRDENVPLLAELGVKAQQYGAITGTMTVAHEGQTLTLQQAARLLERPDRSLRERIWRAIGDRRLADADRLDGLFSELLELRGRVAHNAGFASYTDYKFQELGRFDYGREACLAFHEAIAEAVVPFVDELYRHRQARLGVAELRPWDLAVDLLGERPLEPFDTPETLVAHTQALLAKLDPELGAALPTLAAMGHLDLGSRVGKAPGGYNYPLYETGVSFIFMNAVGSQRDVTTLVHETGHAVHSLVTRDLPYLQDKDTPSEVAELASMSLELLSMDGWGRFYPDPADLRRAQLQEIVGTVTILPWIATIDAFQFWLYDHPGHTPAERKAAWLEIYGRFAGQVVRRDGLEAYEAYLWQRQLHLYEVPFYYIEYGIAQLGALQIWRRYLTEDPRTAVEDYLAALRLGYTQPIGAVYGRAGVRFDFSGPLLQELMAFVRQEITVRGYFA